MALVWQELFFVVSVGFIWDLGLWPINYASSVVLGSYINKHRLFYHDTWNHSNKAKSGDNAEAKSRGVPGSESGTEGRLVSPAKGREKNKSMNIYLIYLQKSSAAIFHVQATQKTHYDVSLAKIHGQRG